MELPADGHVHSEWSWDADLGSMEATTCARAVELGLPAVAFTEHVDCTPFRAGFLEEKSSALGAGLADAARMAEAQGFRPDTRPEDPWIVGR